MSTAAQVLTKFQVPVFPPDELLISDDGVPMDSDWHRIEICLLVELVGQQFATRNDFFAGGDMFIYFSEEQARNRDFRGPDFFFVWGASPMPLRPYWAIWKEGGRYPDVIVELLSPSTEEEDRTTKKDVYEKTFRTSEYYLYEPDEKKLEGWRLAQGKYQPIAADEQGRLWSEQLQLWFGTWIGTYQRRSANWLRLFTNQGILVPTAEESKAVAQQQAAAAQQQILEQRQRAEAAEAELARLKAHIESRPTQD
jgi:Uma2 family endonuclease